MHLPELAYKHKTIFYALIISIIIGGVYSFFKISKLEDPEIAIIQAMVVTVYPGASAEEVEKYVTTVLENEIRTMPNVSDINSTSVANMSQISVMLQFSVPNDEIIQYWDILRKKISDIAPSLPSGAQKPMVIDDFSDVYGMLYAITGDGFDYDELNKYASRIKHEMINVEGVSRVNMFGYQQTNVSIELSAEKMSQLGIYPVQILTAINFHSQPVYAGAYQQGDNTIRLSIDGKFASVDDLKNLLISGYENDQFKLSDIAKITTQPQYPPRFTALYNGKPAIIFGISMQSDVNVIDVGSRVDEKMDEIMPSIPLGIEIEKVFFQPDKVTSAIGKFMRDLVLAVIIVIAVLMLAMNFRSGLIVCGSLIIIVATVFPLLQAMDGTLQRISLGALILALGMLVDDSIVVIDSILYSLQQGRSLKYSLLEAPRKTAKPLLIGTTITIVCFLPVYLSKDTASAYIGDLFIVLCIALATSWFVSLTQVPVFAASIFDLKAYRHKKEEPFAGKLFIYLRKLLNILMVHRLATILCTLLLMALAGLGFMFVKQTFFPDFLYNQAYVEYTLPKETSIDKTISDMKKITEDLMKIEGVKNVTSTHGMTPMRYCLVRAVNQVGDNYAEFIIDFEDFSTMQKLRPQIEKYFYENYPEAYSRFRLYSLSVMTSHNVEVQFSGENMDTLRLLEKQAEDIMRECSLVNPYTISSSVTPPTKVLTTKYAEQAATKIGTTRSDISYTLMAATDGMPIGYLYNDDGSSMPISLKIRNKDGSLVKDLNNLPVWNVLPNFRSINKQDIQNLAIGSQTESEVQKKIISPVPISQVAGGINLEWEESAIQRSNFKRVIQAQCDAKASEAPATVVNKLKDKIEQIHLPEGYTMEWVGEKHLMNVALKNIIGLLPLTAIIIVFLLILLFNDWKRTFIVILCVPVAFIGIVPALLIFSQPYSFVAIVGTIGLAGMLIRNSVVLIDEIDLQRGYGKLPYQAVIDATISRLRAISMTSSATILGVIPLLPDPMYGPLAVVIISGLLVGTIITLVLLPILYSIVFGIKKI